MSLVSSGGSSGTVRMIAISLIGFILLPLGFTCAGIWQLHLETHLLKVGIPVRAQILATEVEEHDGRQVVYRPIVCYRYVVDGCAYEASRVTMLDESGTASWAHSVIRRYPVGSTATAFYDPADPGTAFLAHVPQIKPYLFLLVPLLPITLGLIMLISTLQNRFQATGMLPRDAVSPAALPLALVWGAVTAAVAMHSLLVLHIHSFGLVLAESLAGAGSVAWFMLWMRHRATSIQGRGESVLAGNPTTRIA